MPVPPSPGYEVKAWPHPASRIVSASRLTPQVMIRGYQSYCSAKNDSVKILRGAAEPVTLRALNRATLARQMLLEREKAKPIQAIERLVGLQAQWPALPFVGLWSRLVAFKRQDLARLLDRREVVRGSMMRGTLHVVSKKDYLALRPVFQPVFTRGMLSVLRERAMALDIEKLVAEAQAYLAERPRTFTEVRDHLTALHPGADSRAMGFAVRMNLPLVQVPTEDRWAFAADSAFAVASSWLGRPEIDSKLTSGPRSEDPGPLVLRYLEAFGPATASDVQTWCGLQGLGKVVAGLKPKLRVLKDERGREVFDLPDAPLPPGDTPAPPRLLPEFDNLILGHTDRKRFIADRHRRWVFLPGLRVRATFLVDGFVAGTWDVERKKDVATLTLEPFEALAKKAQGELVKEAGQLVRFVQEDATKFDVRVAKAKS